MVLLCNVLLLCALATALVVPAEPVDVVSMMDKRAPQGIVTAELTPQKFKYMMEIKVGSEGKVFRPLADSGSSVAWLPYSSDNWTDVSPALTDLHQTFELAYVGSSKYLGHYVNDTITFADGKIDNFKLGVIKNPPGSKEGVVGLSRQMGDYSPLPVALKKAGTVDHGVASLYFSAAKQKGKIIFGGYDQAKVASQWSVHSDPKTFKVPITNVTIDGKTHYPDNGDYPIVVDTGAGGSFLPEAIMNPVAELYNNPVAEGAGWNVDCDIPDRLFQLGFGNLILDIPLKDIVNPHTADQKTCRLSISTIERANKLSLIGGALLNHVVTLFDYDEGVVKVAHFKDTDDEDIVKP